MCTYSSPKKLKKIWLKNLWNRLSVLFLVLLVSACTTTRPNNTPGRVTQYNDPNSAGAVSGIGLESQDVISMTDQMMRDMLTSPVLAGRTVPPRVIVDSQYFRNESSTPINKNIITDRLRVALNRASNGQLIFVGRHYAEMVASERDLKRSEDLSVGTIGSSAAPAGADFRLGGRITSQDAVDARTGIASRYNLITFEMVDLETGVIAWSGMYEFKKSARDGIIYR